ncbi:hypothetical protein SDC9_151005 [bioreactor metagenome]|uniref:Uncharacterized protein n=1 Tax=bioreactor metagenome TaxID=1076179 RepID=A0A645EP39_9ZZZZ
MDWVITANAGVRRGLVLSRGVMNPSAPSVTDLGNRCRIAVSAIRAGMGSNTVRFTGSRCGHRAGKAACGSLLVRIVSLAFARMRRIGPAGQLIVYPHVPGMTELRHYVVSISVTASATNIGGDSIRITGRRR